MTEQKRQHVRWVEQWAELGRLYFVKGLSFNEIRRRTGFHR